MEKEEAGEDEDDEDDAEEEETNDKIKENKRPKRKPVEDESDLDSSRYCLNSASTDLSIWVILIEGTEDWRIALLSRSDDTSYVRNEGRLLHYENIINILVRTVVFSTAVDLLI